MDIFGNQMLRILIYVITVGLAGAFCVSVHRDGRRMLNCVLLVLTFSFIWQSCVLVAGYVYEIDISGMLIVPMMVLAVIFAIGLIANGVLVIVKEGFSIAHSLSLLVGGAIIVAIATYIGMVLYVIHMQDLNYGVYTVPKLFEIIFMICMQLAIYLPLMMIGFVIYSSLYQRLPMKRKPKYIVVLGCGIRGDRVTPLLASRLDKGMEFDKKNGGQSIFIVSGGKGSDEIVSEAQAMKTYLLEHGIQEDRIIKEDNSTTTRENLLFSKKIMEERTKDASCVIVTNNFHVLRAAIFARNLDVNGEVIGGKTANYFRPVAAIREHVALILSYRGLFYIYAAGVLILNIWRYFQM
ncbi:MAG: YdcF family protein [Anaerostipes sp.]|nr:YdcF family protein [Anaerostipes sp.]